MPADEEDLSEHRFMVFRDLSDGLMESEREGAAMVRRLTEALCRDATPWQTINVKQREWLQALLKQLQEMRETRETIDQQRAEMLERLDAADPARALIEETRSVVRAAAADIVHLIVVVEELLAR